MATTTRNAAGTGTDPMSIAGRSFLSRSLAGVDFATFDSNFRAALVVEVTPLESVLVDRLILAAWRLQRATSSEVRAMLAREEPSSASLKTGLDAERDLAAALELLETSRAARLGRDDRPAPDAEPIDEPPTAADDFDAPDYSNEWPTLPADAHDIDAEPDVEDSAIPQRWQDRLVFDYNVSETSPVVKGTWITVGHVVSLIVDGWNWSDVLRAHPELTEDDVRMCLAYSVEQDDGGF